MRKRIWVLAALASSTLGAQTRERCPSGPGAAFGISAYQCANCGFKQGDRPIYSFFAEPVVVEANGSTGVTAGDVIEAVNGKPITTSAGAEQFTYPPAGENLITLRRGRERQTVRATVAAACDGGTGEAQFTLDAIERVSVIRGDAAAAKYGSSAASGVVEITTRRSPGTPRPPVSVLDSSRIRVRELAEFSDAMRQRTGVDPLIIVDGVPVDARRYRVLDPGAYPPVGRYGFAVECAKGCTGARGKDGPIHYAYNRYEAFPQIVAVRTDSPAGRAGLQPGDLVVKVEGRSVLEDEGARHLGRLELIEMVRLTVRRGGKDLDYVIRADR